MFPIHIAITDKIHNNHIFLITEKPHILTTIYRPTSLVTMETGLCGDIPCIISIYSLDSGTNFYRDHKKGGFDVNGDT
jgi:hypothetical protein